MKVKELIAYLSAVNPDLDVAVSLSDRGGMIEVHVPEKGPAVYEGVAMIPVEFKEMLMVTDS